MTERSTTGPDTFMIMVIPFSEKFTQYIGAECTAHHGTSFHGFNPDYRTHMNVLGRKEKM